MPKSLKSFLSIAVATSLLALNLADPGNAQSGPPAENTSTDSSMPQFIHAIEGITELKLDNGVQVLLFPDDSKPVVTVNMTVYVGSRHEGYGEAGMAHLLEHMLFKGTDTNPTIPKALQDRGAQFNGTTWLDRTNYYETLTANSENLEFAIGLEADRLVNSRVRGEDLMTEMSVVRSEFERGENSPQRVLQQRLFSAAYEWHNYGKSTIGNRSDIERVPIDALRRFYKKYYRPDNVTLIVAGKFDPNEAVELIQKYFGILENPKMANDPTYTVEPPQDGERLTVVRRVGDTQLVSVGYHIPAGSDPSFAAVDVLSTILADEPSGRLYKALVEGKKATSIYGGSMALHDPGLMFYIAEVPKDKSIEEARDVLIDTLEKSLRSNPVTQAELDRAKQQLLKDRELKAANVTSLSIELSEWAAQGDWRLYFLYRDRVEKVSIEDVQAAADFYLTGQNRTVGLFIPTDTSERLEVPERGNVAKMLDGYKGRDAIAAGEAFDASPDNIEARTNRGELHPKFPYASLPKETRGGAVRLSLSLRFGNEASLENKTPAAEMMAGLMERGTEDYSYQEIRDRLDSLLANVSFSSQPQLLSVSIQTKSDKIVEVLEVVESILRRPIFDPKEFAILKDEAIVSLKSNLSEPQALAPTAVSRAFNKVAKGHIHYVPTIPEEIEMYEALEVSDVSKLYKEQVDGQIGELAIVGQFDEEAVLAAVKKIVNDWKVDTTYKRVDRLANVSVPGEALSIETPDKANAIFYASQQYAMSDADPDTVALTIGNYIFGAGALSSRLGDRVRQKEGLSYGVGSGLSAHPVDVRTSLTIYAIMNPGNKEKVATAIAEELDRLLADGVTEEELKQAIAGYLQSRQVARAEDSRLVGLLSSNLFAKRTMKFYKEQDAATEELTVEQVNAALRKYFAPERLVIVTAGDFAKASADKESEASQEELDTAIAK